VSIFRRFAAGAAVAVAAAATLSPSAALASTTPSHMKTAVEASASRPDTNTSSSGGYSQAGRAERPSTTVVGTVTTTLSVIGTNAFSAEATATATDSAGAATFVYTYNWGDGTAATTADTHVYATVGSYTVTVDVTDSLGNVGDDAFAFATWGLDYSPYGPTRILDTRFGTGAPVDKVPAKGTVKLQVSGAGPADAPIPGDIIAVVLNVTVTNALGSGFITVYNDGVAVPITSNVNYVPGQTVPNLVIVPVSADGVVDLYNGGDAAGSVDLIADVSGYFTASVANGYTSVTPVRLLDTRYGTGAPVGQVPAQGVLPLQIAGADGGQLPASGITAVALNLTATGAKGAGFITAYPAGGTAPNASNVNYTKGQTIANSVIVPVSAGGVVDLLNGGDAAGSVDLVADVVGYYSAGAGSAYAPVYPNRILDTRYPDVYGAGPVANGGELADDTGITAPDSEAGFPDITGFIYNATVTDTKGDGFLTVYPDAGNNAVNDLPTAPPNTSALNWVKGETVPNLVQATPGATDGYIDFYNGGGSGGDTDLILDEFGFYEG
jgi:hypothetical protein